MTKPRVELKVLDERVRSELPKYGTPGSAGVDLRAVIDAPLVLEPGSKAQLVPTGISVHLGDPGLVGMLFARSSTGHKLGLCLGNGTGIIDSDYQGPLMVSAWNRGSEPITIQPMDRIAQLVIVPVVQVEFDVVDEFGGPTERGEGGFGSTGKN